jgi:hypothetical protein
MIVLEIAGLLILATATWLVLNRPQSGSGVVHRRLTTTMLAAGGAVLAGSLVAGVVLAF